jgi:hypothetical protein
MGEMGEASISHSFRTVRQSNTPRIRKSKTFAEVSDEPVVTESLYWRERLIETKRREQESFQDFVKRTLRYMFDNDLIPQEEIELLQAKDYSMQVFGLNHALFEADSTKTRDAAGHSRYWSEPLYGDYYVCSQWWKQKMGVYEPRFAKWISRIIALNNMEKYS